MYIKKKLKKKKFRPTYLNFFRLETRNKPFFFFLALVSFQKNYLERSNAPIVVKMVRIILMHSSTDQFSIWRIEISFLHLNEIVEVLYFHCSLSVCLCVNVCVSVCVSENSCEQNSSWTDAPIWMRFSLNGCLLHWLKPY